MNTGWTEKLIERCQSIVNLWSELGFHGGKRRELSADQVAFLIFADHVETWIGELERIIDALKNPQAEDYWPQCRWSAAAWLAFYTGRVAVIDIHSVGKLASIGCGERDATPRFAHFRKLFDEANDLCVQLRDKYCMGGAALSSASVMTTEQHNAFPKGRW